jgi:phenylalanyl-tRNA synthetase alpha chain
MQTIVEFTAALEELKQHAQRLSEPNETDRIQILGKKGKLNQIAKLLPELSLEDRKIAGQLLNQAKTKIESLFDESTSNSTKNAFFDPTVPGEKPSIGQLHPVTQAIKEIQTIFESIGFTRVRYPEIDWDHYAFTSLNMPKNHPARDEWETFFIDTPEHERLGKMVLTPHTSNGQVREMERVGKPPIRMLNIAKCYRRQQDVTHTAMFHQFEGLVVDKGINIQHLKGTLDYFARKFYGPTAKSRIRPFMFKFTEPSFEVDFSCTHCDGTGCRFCKSGWHEVGGAGMVHPNVLKAGGIDPDIYTGFAFGWGVERVFTLKPGLELDDIRPLYGNDLSLLSKF